MDVNAVRRVSPQPYFLAPLSWQTGQVSTIFIHGSCGTARSARGGGACNRKHFDLAKNCASPSGPFARRK